MEIRSKAAFFDLMQNGLLGNTLRQFGNDPEEALKSDVQYFGIRQIGAAGGGRHGVYSRRLMLDALAVWKKIGCPYNIDEAAPDTDVTLQGEVCRTTRGLEGLLGLYTRNRMRESIRLGLLRPVVGLRVKLLLDYFVDPSSRDDFDILFERYPDAAIEFASYPYTLGRIPRRNTVIWEVRNY